jgi:hypothetical protein
MRKLRDDDQKRKVMKKNPRSWLSMALSAIMLALLWGCATPQQTETLLTKAGFKSVPTSTPPQEEHLRTLSAHKFTKVVRNGTEYFVYPDPQHHVLYVGQSEQYEQYRKLRKSQEWAEETNNAAAAEETEFAVWGGW